MADEGFHEIQLNGKQLVFLFMAATVVGVVIFLCGVMVGRGVRDQRAAEMAEFAAEAPVDPTVTAPPATAATPDGGSAATQEDLSYPARLANDTPQPETLKPVAEAAAPPAPAAERTSARSPTDTEPAGTGFVVQVAAVRERAEADTIARRLTSRGYPAYVMAPAAGAPQVFRVRVGKYKERREAESIATRLEKEEQFKPWITR